MSKNEKEMNLKEALEKMNEYGELSGKLFDFLLSLQNDLWEGKCIEEKLTDFIICVGVDHFETCPDCGSYMTAHHANKIAQ